MNKSNTILFVLEYKNSEFEYGILQNNNYKTFKKKVEPLDIELLQLLEKIFDEQSINSIAVCGDSLGGFVSTRLIIISLNIIAWNRDIPIVNSSKSSMVQRHERNKIIDLVNSEGRFTKQVLPMYHRPPDISKSKKKSKFTIN